MADNPTTVREALMLELMQDVDALVRRVELMDETLAQRIEQSTKDASGKAFLAARLNFESMIEQQAVKLTDAGRHAAALIGNQINGATAQFVAANAALESKAYRFMLRLAGFAFLIGALGGFIGAKLAGI
jgi:hypothetical protein